MRERRAAGDSRDEFADDAHTEPDVPPFSEKLPAPVGGD
jgi:hypothetical protein